MFEQEIRELFDLCMRVKQETNALVLFDFYSNTGCTVYLNDKGFEENGEFDAVYRISSENEILKDDSMKNYQKANEHLNKLIKNGRCPV